MGAQTSQVSGFIHASSRRPVTNSASIYIQTVTACGRGTFRHYVFLQAYVGGVGDKKKQVVTQAP